jgi:hypothetical protein
MIEEKNRRRIVETQRIFTPGSQLHPWGSKFAPRGEIKKNSNWCTYLKDDVW